MKLQLEVSEVTITRDADVVTLRAFFHDRPADKDHGLNPALPEASLNLKVTESPFRGQFRPGDVVNVMIDK